MRIEALAHAYRSTRSCVSKHSLKHIDFSRVYITFINLGLNPKQVKLSDHPPSSFVREDVLLIQKWTAMPPQEQYR
jgi:hypothetical protein